MCLLKEFHFIISNLTKFYHKEPNWTRYFHWLFPFYVSYNNIGMDYDWNLIEVPRDILVIALYMEGIYLFVYCKLMITSSNP